MGDLAPPLSCQLVSSSTGESPSPDREYASSIKAVVQTKLVKEICAESDETSTDVENRFKCGSYGSSSITYGPCDTTLTPDDENNNVVVEGFKSDKGDVTNEDKHDDVEDPFIKVESKKTKAKKANAASTGVKTVTSTTVSPDEKEAQPRSHAESCAVSSPNSDVPSNDGSFAVSFKSLSSLNAAPPKYEDASPYKQQPHHGAQSSFSSLPSASYASATSSPKYQSFTGSYASAINSVSSSSSCKSLPLGATAQTVDAWSTPGERLASTNHASSNIGADAPALALDYSVGMHRCGRPLSSQSSGDGDANDGTESESGSVSGLSVDGFSRPESVASSSSSSCHDEQPGKLFVGSLAASVTEQDLYKYFSQFGEVKSCFIKFDLGTNKSRGFGFVVFREAEVINTVMGYCNSYESVTLDGIRQTRSHVIHGRPIHVRKAKPIAEMKRIRLKDDFDESQQKRVFIGGVPLEVTEEVIQTHFSKVGPVEKVILIFGTSENENGRHRGIGFVTFAQRQHAEAAIRIRYHAIPEHFCTIECKPAIQKGDKSLPTEPPIPKSSPGVNLTLADFHPTVNGTSAPSTNAGILPTPVDSSLDQRNTSVIASHKRPVIEITPPQSWTNGSSASAEDDDGGYSKNDVNNNLQARDESRPPSALSVDSGYSGARSVSPNLDEAAALETIGSSKGGAGNADRGWSSDQRPRTTAAPAFYDEESGYSRGPSILPSHGTRSSTGEDIWLCPSFEKMKVASSNGSFQVVNSAIQGWNPNGSGNCSLALNPYGTNLSLVYPEQMEKILADRFGSASQKARHGGPKETGVPGSAVKYEWNHWSSSKPVGGDVVENGKENVLSMEELPFAPFSRLTFLRDEPTEVRGANGSNGFDVYVR